MTSVLDSDGFLTGSTSSHGGSGTSILRAVSRRRRSDSVITLDGEIDISSAGQIRAVVAECLRTPPPKSLLIDLSAVTFCDCTGIEALEWAYRRASTGRTRFSLRGVDTRLRRIFTLANADGLLDACRPLRIVN
jgi:anti-anti-sigma factor